MKASELQAALARVQQLAGGDIDVVLKDAESEAASIVTGLLLRIDPSAGTSSGDLVIEHGPAPAPSPPAQGDNAGSPPADQTGPPAG